MSYIKLGECEFNTEENPEGGNNLLVFCRGTGKVSSSPFKKGNEISTNSDKNLHNKSMYVSYAKDIFLELSRKSPAEIENTQLMEEAIGLLQLAIEQL